MAATRAAMTLREIREYPTTSSWRHESAKRVFNTEVPAIHVFLSFQCLSEQSLLLNFPLDTAWCSEYGGRIPIRLRGVLQAKLDVNGDRRPRPRFRNRGPGSPWVGLPAHYDAQGSF